MARHGEGVSIDYSDLPGYPAAPTRVYSDPTRIFPRLVREERRQGAREAHRKWREANPDKMLAAQRNWRASQKTSPAAREP